MFEDRHCDGYHETNPPLLSDSSGHEPRRISKTEQGIIVKECGRTPVNKDPDPSLNQVNYE
jgi:hypothetical protein